LSVTIPVIKNTYCTSVVLSDELAIQFDKEVVYNTFDQNRFFVGIRRLVCKAHAFDMGYMLKYQQKNSGYQYDKNDTFRWFFNYTPDFRQKKNKLLKRIRRLKKYKRINKKVDLLYFKQSNQPLVTAKTEDGAADGY